MTSLILKVLLCVIFIMVYQTKKTFLKPVTDSNMALGNTFYSTVILLHGPSRESRGLGHFQGKIKWGKAVFTQRTTFSEGSILFVRNHIMFHFTVNDQIDNCQLLFSYMRKFLIIMQICWYKLIETAICFAQTN